MYVDLIDEILSFSDLQTISAKRIRRGLQERMGHDISHHKVRRFWDGSCEPCVLTDA